MVDIADFVDGVLDDVDGGNPFAAKKAILRAAIEFCKMSECWRYDHADIALIANYSDLELSLPDDSRLRRVTNMLNSDGNQVIEKDSRWLDENVLDWRTATGTVSDTKYFTQAGQSLTIVSVPAETVIPGLFGIKMILVPSQDATTLADILWDDFRDNIEDGAKYFLMRQKGKPWSDPGQAKEYRASFEGSFRDARYLFNKGFSGGTLNVSGTDYTKESSNSIPWYETED